MSDNVSSLQSQSIISKWNKDQQCWNSIFNSEKSNQQDFNTKKLEDKKKNITNWLYPSPINMAYVAPTNLQNHNHFLQLRLSQVKDNIQNLEIHQLTLASLEQTNNIAAKLEGIQDELVKLQQEKANLEEDVGTSNQVSNIFNNKIDIPDCAQQNPTDIQWKQIWNSIPNKVDGSNREEFDSNWKIIKSLCESNQWTEENLDEVIKYTLIGEARDFYNENRNKPFPEKLHALLTLYLPYDNYQTRKTQLKKYKRRVGDSLEQFMIKLQNLIDRTAIGYPDNIRTGRKPNIMELALHKVCSKSAREKIDDRVAEALEKGYFLTIDDKITIAARQEQLLQDAPEFDIPINIEELYDKNKGAIAQLYHTQIIDPTYDSEYDSD